MRHFVRDVLRATDLGCAIVQATAPLRLAPHAFLGPAAALYAPLLGGHGLEDHAKSVAQFWRKFGFDSAGLAKGGVVGKSDWDEDEPRSLVFPAYLQDRAAPFAACLHRSRPTNVLGTSGKQLVGEAVGVHWRSIGESSGSGVKPGEWVLRSFAPR